MRWTVCDETMRVFISMIAAKLHVRGRHKRLERQGIAVLAQANSCAVRVRKRLQRTGGAAVGGAAFDVNAAEAVVLRRGYEAT